MRLNALTTIDICWTLTIMIMSGIKNINRMCYFIVTRNTNWTFLLKALIPISHSAYFLCGQRHFDRFSFSPWLLCLHAIVPEFDSEVRQYSSTYIQHLSHLWWLTALIVTLSAVKSRKVNTFSPPPVAAAAGIWCRHWFAPDITSPVNGFDVMMVLIVQAKRCLVHTAKPPVPGGVSCCCQWLGRLLGIVVPDNVQVNLEFRNNVVVPTRILFVDGLKRTVLPWRTIKPQQQPVYILCTTPPVRLLFNRLRVEYQFILSGRFQIQYLVPKKVFADEIFYLPMLSYQITVCPPD